jgi:predicted Zn-dependent protease
MTTLFALQNQRSHHRAILVILLLIAVSTSACVVQRNPVTGKKRAYGYSWQQELQIGQEADPQIIAQYGLYDDPAMTAYVDRIGQQVVAQSHLRRPDTPQEFKDAPITFRVLDSPIVNAFALPGGYIYVTRGLMAHVQNEAQLAVVLGHEVGHVAARHGSKQAFQQQLGQLGLFGAAIGGELLGLPGGEILNSGSTIAGLLFLRYSRDDERESDNLGVEYASMSRYRSEEGSKFFTTLKRLGESSGQSIPSFYSSHPDPGEREQTIIQLAKKWEETLPMDIIGVNEHLAVIDGIVLGEDPRQGYTDENVFYHPQLRFMFPVPRNWTVINQPSQVAMVNSDQSAVMVMTLAQGVANAREGASKFAQQEGLTVVEQGQSSGGYLPAWVVVVDAQQQNGSVIRAVAHFIDYGGNVYQFIGYTAQPSFQQYSAAFVSTMQGFNRLADQARINIKPNRLKIVTADKSAPFSTMLPAQLPRNVTQNELAILNQVDAGETIPVGRRLKLVQ